MAARARRFVRWGWRAWPTRCAAWPREGGPVPGRAGPVRNRSARRGSCPAPPDRKPDRKRAVAVPAWCRTCWDAYGTSARTAPAVRVRRWTPAVHPARRQGLVHPCGDARKRHPVRASPGPRRSGWARWRGCPGPHRARPAPMRTPDRWAGAVRCAPGRAEGPAPVSARRCAARKRQGTAEPRATSPGARERRAPVRGAHPVPAPCSYRCRRGWPDAPVRRAAQERLCRCRVRRQDPQGCRSGPEGPPPSSGCCRRACAPPAARVRKVLRSPPRPCSRWKGVPEASARGC
ncbi:hypothetical protein SSPIM334S_07966 [Streptomyces spiroverticillatus]